MDMIELHILIWLFNAVLSSFSLSLTNFNALLVTDEIYDDSIFRAPSTSMGSFPIMNGKFIIDLEKLELVQNH